MVENNIAKEFKQQYLSGKRKFYKAQLQKADLKDESLKQVGLRAANLNYANLKNADLSNADLRDSSLIRAELSGANLSQADLAGANLSRANLVAAQLIETDLTGACLNQACLTAAKLITVDLRYANLSGAYLLGVDLSQSNLTGAFYDEQTSFPDEFDPASSGMLPDYKIENLLIQFDHICNCSNKYLGNKMTAKYFNDSRPDFDWLNNFQLDESNQITFEGGGADSVSSLQLLWFQKWLKDFIKLCSTTIKHFPQLLN